MKNDLTKLNCRRKTKDMLKAEASKKGLKLMDYLDQLAGEKDDIFHKDRRKRNGFYMRL